MASTSAAKRSAMKKSPNWLEMPDELMANILERLGTVEILKSSQKVCTTWRRICKDPAMWKVIVIRKLFGLRDERDADYQDYVLERLTMTAVDLSCGELIDITIDGFGTDDFLDHIVRRSRKLKCLRLICCFNVTGRGVSRAVKRVPQLEKLHLIYYKSIKAEEIKAIGRNSPKLKSFIMGKRFGGKFINCDKRALAIANNMPELRHLDLSGKSYYMTNIGLEAILNGCPHLQSLDARGCCKLYLGGELGKLCMERIKDFKYDSTVST